MASTSNDKPTARYGGFQSTRAPTAEGLQDWFGEFPILAAESTNGLMRANRVADLIRALMGWDQDRVQAMIKGAPAIALNHEEALSMIGCYSTIEAATRFTMWDAAFARYAEWAKQQLVTSAPFTPSAIVSCL